MSSFVSTDKAIVLQCRCLNHLFTKIRDQNTTRKEFVTYSRRLMRVICEEGIACLAPGVCPAIVAIFIMLFVYFYIMRFLYKENAIRV